MPKKVKQLNDQFRPENYKLELVIDEKAMNFNGTVLIKGRKIGRPSKRLTFHQKDLKVTAASVVRLTKQQEEIEVVRLYHQRKLDEIRLHFDHLISPGEYLIRLEFSGQIDEQMHGIYPCFFKHAGKQKKLIATQFESHHAREAFPCIDEPAAKATFDLTISCSPKQEVLSNTPALRQKIINSKLVTTFETTPIMSSYLLAFVLGEMHSVSAKTSDGIIVSSWSSVAQPKDSLKYATHEAVKILDFFADYFKTPFPLKKLDNVALPDLESGAMENWGLITYREIALMSDPLNRSLSSEQYVTSVVAHEISHQWFGNLVTMQWWNDLWLNESFASLMQDIASDELHPDWQQWEDFATSTVISCSHRDIYRDVQSVGVEVKHPDEIMSLFDPAIVYAKGARLLAMLRQYIGDDNFRKGLQNYFKKYAYKNTTMHELWQSLSETSQVNLDKFMTPWIIKPGQPRLVVETALDNKIKLTQERFLVDSIDKNSLWPIPLLSDQALGKDVLDKRSLEITYEGKDLPLFNLSGNGHYIVEYKDEAMVGLIRSKIIKRHIDSISRVSALNDMLLLARIGEYELTDQLKLVFDARDEPRDAVWSMFSRIVGQAQTLTDGNQEAEVNIKKYKHALSRDWFTKLGWKDASTDDPNTIHLRSTILALSLAGENPEAIQTALSMFESAGSVAKLPAEQRAMIASTAVRNAKASTIKSLMEEYQSTSDPDVKQSISASLCSTKDPKVAAKLIDWGLVEGGAVRMQDVSFWFAYLMRNPYTRELAWEWMIKSWKYLEKMSGSGKSMEYFVWYSSGPLSTKDWLKRYRAFFDSKANQLALKRNIAISFSEIEARIKWREREEESLLAYFKNF